MNLKSDWNDIQAPYKFSYITRPCQKKGEPGTVAHAHNPSCLADREQEDGSLRKGQPRQKNWTDHISTSKLDMGMHISCLSY
jgi:hypothetical protein